MIQKTNIILYFLTMGLIIAFIFAINKINYLEVKIENLNTSFVKMSKNDSPTEQQLKYQQFKEDAYIKQQEWDTNLLLIVMPTLFALIGFFTFKSSSEEFSFFRNEMTNKHDEHAAKNESVHNKLLELQQSLIHQSSTINRNRADSYLSKNDKAEYFLYTLLSLSDTAEYYLYNVGRVENQGNAKAEQSILLIIATLKQLNGLASSEINQHTIASMVIPNIIRRIRKIENQEIDALLSKIHTKITT